MPDAGAVTLRQRWLGAGAVLAVCIGLAILYGEVHDQITAHLCVEYFTVAHPRVIASEDPAMLALVWGVLATWWVGAALGMALGAVCWAGRMQPLRLRRLWGPMGTLLAVMAGGALLAGSVGWVLSAIMGMPAPGGWDRVIPAEKQGAFTAAAFAHVVSYVLGAAGGLVLVVYAWVLRKALHQAGSSYRGRSYNA